MQFRVYLILATTWNDVYVLFRNELISEQALLYNPSVHSGVKNNKLNHFAAQMTTLEIAEIRAI
jgi:hypothetical protein